MKNSTVRVSSVIENLDRHGLPEGDREQNGGEYQAEYFYADGKAVIRYSESGESGEVKTVIIADGAFVTVERHGAVNSRFEFRKGQSHSSLYQVPPYSFDTTVTARRVDVSLASAGGSVDLLYNMSIGGADKAVRMKIWISTNTAQG